MEIHNTSELKSALMSHISTAVYLMRDKVYEIIDERLVKFYLEYTPDMYVRTQQLLHSLVKTGVQKVGDGYEAYVYFDYNSLNYRTGANPSGYQVMVAAADGKHGADGLRTVDGDTSVWTQPVMQIRQDLRDMLQQALIRAGIPIK